MSQYQKDIKTGHETMSGNDFWKRNVLSSWNKLYGDLRISHIVL